MSAGQHNELREHRRQHNHHGGLLGVSDVCVLGVDGPTAQIKPIPLQGVRPPEPQSLMKRLFRALELLGCGGRGRIDFVLERLPEAAVRWRTAAARVRAADKPQ